MTYDIEDISAPRAAGPLLRALAVALESGVTGPLLARQLLGNVGLPAFREVAADDPFPTRHPAAAAPRDGAGPVAVLPEELLATAADERPAPQGEGLWPETAEDFVRAYRDGRTTPEQVTERIIEAVADMERGEPPMRTFIAMDEREVRDQARASTARWARGEPASPLDGVPVAVKDELDVRPYPSRGGTKFLGGQGATADAEVVARLRRAGAVLLGKANMQEIGIGVMGYNPHYGSARNPFDRAHLCGGSSSGSAAAVAAGLCPMAMGVDGGGSIRIPASFCGQVGLMPTFGRVSEHGAVQLAWTVSHVGPIAATARDAALAYALIAGPDTKDTNTLGQPAPHLEGAFPADEDERPLEGLVLGVYRPWFEHAESEVVDSCRSLLQDFEAAGASVREIEIPELSVLRTVHLVTIISEMVASQMCQTKAHGTEYSAETRVNLALGRRMKSSDYVHAQRLRVRLCRHFDDALAEVDAIVTPTTGCTAPPAAADALATGESNLPLTGQIMRFAPAANLTGRPTISIPAGYDGRGLPIGLQAMGRYWSEPTLLRLAAVAERTVSRRPPTVGARLLDDGRD